MKLTHENYHTLENRFLSNSRMGDWKRGHHYFEGKHITGTIITEPTSAMLVGSATDCILTESWDKFYEQYYFKVLKKDDPETFELQKSGEDKRHILSPADYEKAINSNCFGINYFYG